MIPPRPTDGELALLRILWRLGPSTVRDVLHAFNEGRDEAAGYTTVLKLMQIMHGKGLLARDDTVRPQVYRAVLGEERTRRDLLRDLLARAFGGSHKDLVLQALSDRHATDAEIAEVAALLERLEERK
jgi:predicted transcriptional regulator